PDDGLELSGLQIDYVDGPQNNRAIFDLSLSIREEAGQLIAGLDYSTDLFDESTILRMSHHFESVLALMTTAIDQQIDELPILSESEKHQLLFKWNDTDTAYRSGSGIHELFEEQVEIR